MTAVTPFLLTHNNMQGGFRLDDQPVLYFP